MRISQLFRRIKYNITLKLCLESMNDQFWSIDLYSKTNDPGHFKILKTSQIGSDLMSFVDFKAST